VWLGGVRVVSELQVLGLGPLEVLVAGQPVTLGGRKQRTVLALLALRANATVPVDTLVEAVWAGAAPDRPTSVLQVYAANLRRVLEPDRAKGANGRLVSAAGGYRLLVAPEEADVLVFERLVAEAGVSVEAGELAGAAAALRAAVALWRGPAFPDLVDAQDARAEVAALGERRLTAVEDLLELDLSLGGHAAVAVEAATLVADFPFRERLRAAQITALYRGQRQGEALAACRAARRFLADELGADPGPELLELERSVLASDPALLQKAPGSGRRRARLGNLPTPVSTFIRRDAELAELAQLLRHEGMRLLTLTGPGGTGKTRLALAAAASAEAAFEDGVCWVPLEAVPAAEQVLGAVAAALGVTSASPADLQDATLAFLHPRRLLLVLDNFEHVLDGWPLVTTLLVGAPGLTVLVTSRAPLHVTGEQRFAVPPLTLPAMHRTLTADAVEGAEAVRLFTTRAALVDRGFLLTDDNAAFVAAICHRLDGLPLAIELAAARAGDYSPPVLLDALEDVLGVLVDGPRDVNDRQRTLRGAIAWSHGLLDADHRRVFTDLAVFAGAPSLDAVRAVSAATRDGVDVASALEALVLAGLVAPDGPREALRFRMMRTVRAYAEELLTLRGDQTGCRRRHAEYYLDRARLAARQIHGPQEVGAVTRMHAERPEFDAALEWAAGARGDGGDLPIALGLIGHLWDYWQITGEIDQPRRHAEQVLRHADHVDPALRASALSGAGTLCWLNGDIDAARDYHGQALQVYTLLGDRRGTAWSTLCLATQDIAAGHLDAARERAETALALGRSCGHVPTVSTADIALGVIASYNNDLDTAEDRLQEALAVARESGAGRLTAMALVDLANIAESRGEYERAIEYLIDSLAVATQLGNQPLAVFGIETMAELRLRLGAPHSAARLLGAAHAYRTDLAQPLDKREREELDAVIDQTRGAIGNVAFAVAWAEGTGLSVAQAVDHALTIAQPAS
jgi:predicted ATPase/DNA-binding SARP family transcriptional activator